MKKIAVFFLIIVIIVVAITYMYIDYQKGKETLKKENQVYESYLNKEINGLDVTSVINKAVDRNTKNEVSKDSNGYYIEDENSIKIDIKIIDTDKTYSMEEIYKGEMNQFASYYGNIKFKCTNIEYHEKNGKVRYMLFEQVTI